MTSNNVGGTGGVVVDEMRADFAVANSLRGNLFQHEQQDDQSDAAGTKWFSVHGSGCQSWLAEAAAETVLVPD